MNENHYIRSLLDKQIKNGLSVDEQHILNRLLNTAEGEKVLHEYMNEQAAEVFDHPSVIPASYSLEIFQSLKESMRHANNKRLERNVKMFLVDNAWKIAASFIGFIILSLLSVMLYNQYQVVNYATGYGQKETIILPDLSTVTLNGNSKLSYKRDWNHTVTREVVLEGEAYFDVVKNKQKPFYVHADNIEIKVLGTSFNVKCYHEDDAVEATLVEGKIALNNRAEQQAQEIILVPNQKATYFKSTNSLKLNEVKTEIYTSWKSGKLIFEDEYFGEILKDLERRYGVRIGVEDEAVKKCRFSATINHESLKEVLDLFVSTTDLSYQITDNNVTIKGSLCINNQTAE